MSDTPMSASPAHDHRRGHPSPPMALPGWLDCPAGTGSLAGTRSLFVGVPGAGILNCRHACERADLDGSSFWGVANNGAKPYLPVRPRRQVPRCDYDPPHPHHRGEPRSGRRFRPRSRAYDPRTGTFTTSDPLDGVDGTPTIANRYHYAHNDALNSVDPLGLTPRASSYNRTPQQTRLMQCVASYPG